MKTEIEIRKNIREEIREKNKKEFRHLLSVFNKLIFAPFIAAIFGIGSFILFSLVNKNNDLKIIPLFFAFYMTALFALNL